MTDTLTYKILITDDDRDSRESLREIVEPVGFQAYLAGSGEEALDIIVDRDVHIVLMDMYLPKMTGLETLEVARQIKGLVPAILMSGESDEELLRRALSAHAFCVLAKPVSRSVVIHVVSRALDKFYRRPPRES
jgi:CheY-like chemotaxis protein